MNKQTFYGLDKKGGYKVWKIWTEGDTIYIEHGKEGGKQQLKTDTVKGKNIGRANETTPEQQAVLEAKSRLKKQKDKGYRRKKEELENLPILPMLAVDFDEKKHKIEYPCYASPKLDGLRATAKWEDGKIVLISRGNQQYTVEHIQKELESVLMEGEIIDGEIYCHDLILEDISSSVKKPNENTPRLSYWVFDVVESPEYEITQESPFEKRLEALLAIEEGWIIPSHIEITPYSVMNDEEEVMEEHEMWKILGYEGLMLRNKKGVYESGKRSNDLQKVKEMMDEEFLVFDITEDKNGNAVLHCKNNYADNDFTVTYGDFDKRKEFLKNKNKYIGKWLTVEFQKLFRDTKLPQFPVGKGFRLEEDM